MPPMHTDGSEIDTTHNETAGWLAFAVAVIVILLIAMAAARPPRDIQPAPAPVGAVRCEAPPAPSKLWP